jgi:hypothetical protein
MIQVPYWDQNPNHPYPSVTLRIDFRGNDVGTFVFHCHILGHEDLGMMNIIHVQPSAAAANSGGAAKPNNSTTTGSSVPVASKGTEKIKMKME